MRIPLKLSLCLVACTLENPAFHATQTDGVATAASTTSATATDPTRTTGEPGPTTSTSTSTSGPDATTGPGVTTDVATTMNVSDSAATIDPPATTSTTEPPMTASSDPGETTTGGPNMCDAFADPLGPYLELESLPNFFVVPADVCSLWPTELGGRLMADGGGFIFKKDIACAPDNLVVPGLRFTFEQPGAVLGNGACAILKFTIHPQYMSCTISSFQVLHEDVPVLWGSFGAYPFPPTAPLQLGLGPKGVCDCPDCCGPEVPDPDAYKFLVNGAGIGENAPQLIDVDGDAYLFSTLRAHVHAPECMTDAPKPDWLHFDWVVARAP